MTKDDIKLIMGELKHKNKFSLALGFSHLLATANYFFKSEKLRNKSYEMHNNAVIKYLYRYATPALERSKNRVFDRDVDFSKEPVFVCWFQGEDGAPDLVKRCIASIKQHAANHEVVLITRENLSDFLDIPEYLMEKFNAGKICDANFSDYIRTSLLFKYGGLWLDATVFCRDIPEWIFEKDFFTVNFGFDPNSSNLAKGRWTGFIIGGRRNYPPFAFFKNCFEMYWKNEQTAIDYFLFDYFIQIAYDNIPAFKKDLDNLPVSNPCILKMYLAFKNNLLPSEWKFSDDTFFYKLSRRFNYNMLTENGEKTLYGLFLDNGL